LPDGAAKTPFLIDVALALPSGSTFQYSVPDAMRSRIELGKRVSVLVRSRPMMGYVVGLSQEKVVDEVRSIASVVDETSILPPSFLELTRWMAEYYFCTWGQAIESALPAPFKKGRFVMKSRAQKTGAGAEVVDPHDLPLTPGQDAAYREAMKKVEEEKPGTFLLHGITGSGKTEVYMHLIREMVQRGKGSIVLVPEISLTPQTVDRFYSRFGDCLAVIHSRLSQAKRVEEWHRIRSGEAKVVVGARSAIFSPVKNLGLIVIDEEHDTSYKQDETPRYHTRRVAEKRAELENAVLVLGGATPSLETFWRSQEGAVKRLELSRRIENRPLPEVEIVDMRRQEGPGKGDRIFSNVLEKAVRETLARGEQVMLFLNRRGFSTYLHCNSCGYVSTCPNCRISLAYHYDKAAVFCHICQHRATPERMCPSCKKSNLHYFGIGTQKVESEALRLFPSARIARMDTDSTSKKNAHENFLRSFKKGDTNLLIGTQMIAKGHDFPNVSLVGVISADTALHIPDFRAAERTFSLLTQVAGRAGRGDVPGKVLVQTHVPAHYSILCAKTHDYAAFYEKEIEFRRDLGLPPFTSMVRVALTGAAELDVARQSMLLARYIETRSDAAALKVLGPAPALISKENGQFRWNFFVKGPSVEVINPVLRKALAEFKRVKVTLTVDVDPQ
jgi:primosomal protein N' (replication factor Y)